jgi:hypothetical protein
MELFECEGGIESMNYILKPFGLLFQESWLAAVLWLLTLPALLSAPLHLILPQVEIPMVVNYQSVLLVTAGLLLAAHYSAGSDQAWEQIKTNIGMAFSQFLIVFVLLVATDGLRGVARIVPNGSVDLLSLLFVPLSILMIGLSLAASLRLSLALTRGLRLLQREEKW